MKKLFTLTTLIFTVMFLSNCDETPNPSGNWKKLTENDSGGSFYLDFETIRKQDGYVYWWELGDYLRPTPEGILSGKIYKQGDCKLFRLKRLSGSFHKEPMGRGTGDSPPIPESMKDWKYPPPNSVDEIILKKVCEYVN